MLLSFLSLSSCTRDSWPCLWEDIPCFWAPLVNFNHYNLWGSWRVKWSSSPLHIHECFAEPLCFTFIQPARECFQVATLVMSSIIFCVGWDVKSCVDDMSWIQVAKLLGSGSRLITRSTESWQSASALLWWWWLIKPILAFLYLLMYWKNVVLRYLKSCAVSPLWLCTNLHPPPCDSSRKSIVVWVYMSIQNRVVKVSRKCPGPLFLCPWITKYYLLVSVLITFSTERMWKWVFMHLLE